MRAVAKETESERALREAYAAADQLGSTVATMYGRVAVKIEAQLRQAKTPEEAYACALRLQGAWDFANDVKQLLAAREMENRG